MRQPIINMLERYDCNSEADYENALKQIIQQITLLGLWRAKFFEHAAFYGGTALRILYQLERFSEDLDFSLLKPSKEFDIGYYFQAINAELESFGFEIEISKKIKTSPSDIQSAFLKANTQVHLLKIQAPNEIANNYHGKKELKIKIELDDNPPLGFTTESVTILRPIPFWVKAYCLPDLFAGKISALLCRQWKTRVKGRDWFDFLWFVQRCTPVNLKHLELRLKNTSYDIQGQTLDEGTLTKFLHDKIDSLDIELAKNDIKKFITDPSILDGWSKDMFRTVTSELTFC